MLADCEELLKVQVSGVSSLAILGMSRDHYTAADIHYDAHQFNSPVLTCPTFADSKRAESI